MRHILEYSIREPLVQLGGREVNNAVAFKGEFCLSVSYYLEDFRYISTYKRELRVIHWSINRMR